MVEVAKTYQCDKFDKNFEKRLSKLCGFERKLEKNCHHAQETAEFGQIRLAQLVNRKKRFS